MFLKKIAIHFLKVQNEWVVFKYDLFSKNETIVFETIKKLNRKDCFTIIFKNFNNPSFTAYRVLKAKNVFFFILLDTIVYFSLSAKVHKIIKKLNLFWNLNKTEYLNKSHWSTIFRLLVLGRESLTAIYLSINRCFYTWLNLLLCIWLK